MGRVSDSYICLVLSYAASTIDCRGANSTLGSIYEPCAPRITKATRCHPACPGLCPGERRGAFCPGAEISPRDGYEYLQIDVQNGCKNREIDRNSEKPLFKMDLRTWEIPRFSAIRVCCTTQAGLGNSTIKFSVFMSFIYHLSLILSTI